MNQSNKRIFSRSILGVLATFAFLAGFFGTIGFLSDTPTVHAATNNDSKLVSGVDQSYFNDTDQSDTTAGLAHADVSSSVNDAGTQCRFLTDSLRIDFNNDPSQVYRLQAFLKAYAYDYVELTGRFDLKTLKAVKEFQTRHSEEILAPWGYQPDEATGYVYITTRHKINEIYCGQEFQFSQSQLEEMRRFEQKLARLRNQGATFETPQYLQQYFENIPASKASLNRIGGKSSETEDEEQTISADATNTDTVAATGGLATTSPGLFARIFGFGSKNKDKQNKAEKQQGDISTTTQDNQGEVTKEQSTATNTTVTSTVDNQAATSGVDQVATSVYSGVNSALNFIFSPTFLLILLVVLVLLLIATLLEDENGNEDLGADLSQNVNDDGNDNNQTGNNTGLENENSSDQSNIDNPKEESASDAADAEAAETDTGSETEGKQDSGLSDADPEDDVITFDANGNDVSSNESKQSNESGSRVDSAEDLFGNADK